MITPMIARQAAKDALSARRFYHTRCVASAAFWLALKNGVPVRKALIAGYLHDIAKEMPKERMLQTLSGTAIIKSIDFERGYGVAHAFVGEIAARALGVDDPEILAAIRYHSTGCVGMSALEKVVYVADYTGRDRRHPEAPVARKLARRSLDSAVLYIMDCEIRRLTEKGCYLVPLTLQARDSMKKENEK